MSTVTGASDRPSVRPSVGMFDGVTTVGAAIAPEPLPLCCEIKTAAPITTAAMTTKTIVQPRTGPSSLEPDERVPARDRFLAAARSPGRCFWPGATPAGWLTPRDEEDLLCLLPVIASPRCGEEDS